MATVRQHALLFVVYGAGLLLAAYELSHPDVQQSKLDFPDAYPEAYVAPELNIADVSAAVHPGRALSLYYAAQQAALCAGGRARDPDTVCPRRGPPRPGEIRELLERSLATGNRSIELVMYNHAIVLLHEGAPAEEVEAAVRAWRLAYPASSHPDPRDAFREMQQARRGARPGR